MNSQKYDELEHRSTDQLEKLLDGERALARQVVKSEAARMIRENEAYVLSDEEIRMLNSFRRFKQTCRAGEVFKWQTRPEEGIIEPGEQVLIRDPQEVS